ncbi:MAG: polyprenyl synthetase family protein [Sedimentisphaerales bacterium]|nr:polyprenyl synthetase family protein [Sedimentisphaerales bacterium]
MPAFKLIAEPLNQVRRLIYQQLTTHQSCIEGLTFFPPRHRPEEVNRLLEYINRRSGKMIRPGLVLLSGLCFGKVTDEHVRVAAIIEMMHNATLLHDDVIDEGRIRRGAPTINSLWGNETAVLLGDLLLSRIFTMSADLKSSTSKIIAEAAVRLCEGELKQAVQKNKWQLNESEYIEAITEKSAILFSSACYLGGLLANTSPSQAHSLAEFGLNAGIAFQLTDDVLDIVGDESKTGKTLGSDMGAHKLTLAVIHLLRTVDESERNTIIDVYLENKDIQRDRNVLIKILDRYGSLDYARRRSQEYVTAAIGALCDLERNSARDALVEMAEFTANRSR